MSEKPTTGAVRAGVVDALRAAAHTAQETGEWVILVCPDGSEFLSSFAASASGALPSGTSFQGRTAVLHKGGRLSVAAVSDDPFVPDGVPFSVVFHGWGDDLAADNRRMLVWRQRATRVLR